MSHTLFISDLHLEPQRPEITRGFLDFLQHRAPQADALYILGDFFEVWIGDDEDTAFHRSIISALKQLTDRGLPIYVMRGNRDFLLDKHFMQVSGCRFLHDPSEINLYGKKILLSHGDMLCTSDIKHQNFRKYTQNPRYRQLFLCLPLVVRRIIARLIRKMSQKHATGTSFEMMDVVQQAVEQQMRESKVLQLIHGHTHRPAIHEFLLDGELAGRVVLGDWHKQGSVLVYTDNGKVKLMPLPYSIE